MTLHDRLLDVAPDIEISLSYLHYFASVRQSHTRVGANAAALTVDGGITAACDPGMHANSRVPGA
jgi:hypothetical protein